ncbi:MAG: MarR family transcriptional regulator [Streptococcaceae bacterium]|jgi:DNA-binding MarR family transcriptional regulator|nr:MarR family transcriptional regulator [Streptococcaceae bacterium]MCH4176854.1 MarR family transcriptional regulator [Streptococcaceae bacterium]
MENSVSIFNRIYDKFMTKYYEENHQLAAQHSLSARDEYYLDLIYTMPEPTSSKFAQKAQISKAAATQIMTKFIELGYVIKTPSKEDKRVIDLRLSSEMKAYFAASYQLMAELYDQSLTFLTDIEKRQLDQILRKIDRNL